MSEKKQQQLAKRGLFSQRAAQREVEFIPVESREDLQRAKPDIVLSKSFPGIDPSLVAALHAFREVFPVSGQEIFSDRWLLLQRLEEDGVTVPFSRLVSTATSESELDDFLLRCGHGQVIVKPRTACGPKSSHDILISRHASEIRNFVSSHPDNEFVLQELVQHEKVFFKVFVIGDDISVFARKSIQSDMQGVINTQGLFSTSVEMDDSQDLQAVFRGLGIKVCEIFNARLLGIDLILNSHAQPVVVDVNFFPSYNELGDQFISQLDEYCLSLVWLILFC